MAAKEEQRERVVLARDLPLDGQVQCDGAPLATRTCGASSRSRSSRWVVSTGDNRVGGSYAASAARCNPAMSILLISSIAFMTRCDLSGSGSLSSSVKAVGMICQDRPYRSLSQPHGPSSPPSESDAHSS